MNKIHTRFPRHSIFSNLFSQGLLRIAVFALSAFFLTFHSKVVKAEGSGRWGVTGNRQANLIGATTGNNGGDNEGYVKRGYMLLPSDTQGYLTEHRLYVWVKNGETVFWGFHQDGDEENNRSMTFRWYYDTQPNSPAGVPDYFPDAKTSGTGRTTMQEVSFYPRNSNSNTQGIPQNASRATAGPRQIVGNATGYYAHSFKNETGQDRAFWLEITYGNNNSNAERREFNFWDITVAKEDSPGNYTVHPGRVYCKYWHLVNSLPTSSGSSNSTSFPKGENEYDGFGFYIPIDNANTNVNDFFVKYANFGGSNAGFVVFFANSTGPGTDNNFAEDRKSKAGISTRTQYPLFLNNPDPSVWPSAILPEWSVTPVFFKRMGTSGGQGEFTVTVNTACVIDILLDLNNNNVYDPATDLLFNHQFTGPGSYVFEWDGKYANGTDVPVGNTIKFISSLAFFPVHFPIFDMEQSLGIAIWHIRPGTPYDDVLYWDDTNITGSLADAGNPKSNTTGRSGRSHKWFAVGDAGYSQNNTINTWTGAYNRSVTSTTMFNYDDEVDLAVTKKIASGENPEPEDLKDEIAVAAGEKVTFKITVKNLAIDGNTPVTATGVKVKDILPAGYTLVSMDLPPGTSWDALNNDWVIGDMEVGAELTMVIIAEVKSTGPYLNEAVASANESETNYTNNKDDATLKQFQVSGNVFHDPDAGNVNISTTGGINTIPAGVYANLVDGQTVFASVLVPHTAAPGCEPDCPVIGAFSFNTIPGQFTVALSSAFITPGSPLPVSLPLPTGWRNTGDFNGAPNTGTNASSVDGKSEAFDVVDADVSNINFGIQKPPVTDDSKYSLLEEPVSGITLPLDGTIEAKSNKTLDEIIASDADGQLTTLIITSLAEAMPSGSGTPGIPVLLYDGVPVVLNTPITGFDPAKLSIRLDGGNYVGVFFKFKVIDNGGAESNISTYTVDWLSPLPVKWKSVDVKEENSNAVVSWSTTEELNVDYFEVQYSADARSWQTIGTRKAMNTAKAGYSFTHKLDRNGIHYFRVQSIDLDGSISKSPIVSLKGGKEFAGIVLYPNPVLNGELTMDTQLANVKHVSIFTTAGVLLKSEAPKSSTLDIRNLPGGVYILQVTYGNGETAAKTFVVR